MALKKSGAADAVAGNLIAMAGGSHWGSLALVYLVIVMLLTWLFGKLERRLRADER